MGGFFLIGNEYIASLGFSPSPSTKQKFVYYGTGIERSRLPANNLLVLPAAQKESKRYSGAGVTGIKGRMFELFARGITGNPTRWQAFLQDKTAVTFVDLMNTAKENSLEPESV